MIDENDASYLIKNVKGLKDLNSEEIGLLKKNCYRMTLEKGTVFSKQGLILVKEGQLRTYIHSGDRMYLLYPLIQGDFEALTSPALLANVRLNIRILAFKTTKILFLPEEDAVNLEKNHIPFERDIRLLLAKRLETMLERLDEISFSSLEERLCTYLTALGEDNVLHMTHEEIAKDNGTEREVVSRCLRKLEKKGMIKCSRGEIRILQIPGKGLL